jgi:hypothetical protein
MLDRLFPSVRSPLSEVFAQNQQALPCWLSIDPGHITKADGNRLGGKSVSEEFSRVSPTCFDTRTLLLG